MRVLDLTTGAFAFEDEVPGFAPHHTIWSVELDSHLRWSSDGRYVAYYYSFGIYAGDWITEGIDVEVLDTTGRAGSAQDPPFSRLMDDCAALHAIRVYQACRRRGR